MVVAQSAGHWAEGSEFEPQRKQDEFKYDFKKRKGKSALKFALENQQVWSWSTLQTHFRMEINASQRSNNEVSEYCVGAATLLKHEELQGSDFVSITKS